ncbi:MAG: hypothetical protein WAT93_05655 [Pontixanthobacter sp.]
MTTQYTDPLDAATEAGNRPDSYFGRMEVAASFVKLQKGVGKTPWSDADGIDARRTEVHLILNPIEATALTFMLERKPIAESSEWSKIIWASLRDCGLKAVRDLHGKYAKVEMVKTGRKFENRSGETVEEKTMQFTALFDDLSACEAAYYAERGGKPAAQNGNPGEIDMSPGAGGNGPAPASNAERETAKQFLSVLVKQAGGDVDALAGLIASMPLVSKYFSITSPEVLEAMGVKA